MPELETLSLKDNVLKEFPKAIVKMKKLKKLTLFISDLSTIPDEFGTLTELEELDLRSDGIRDLSEILIRFTKIKTLHISPKILSTEHHIEMRDRNGIYSAKIEIHPWGDLS